MRTKKDVENSNRHNETKLAILKIFAHPTSWRTSADVSEITGLTIGNAYRQMTKLHNQKYIWRQKKKNGYKYKFLKHHGERVLKKLWIREQLIIRSRDINITMNLSKPVSNKYAFLVAEIEQDFNSWLHSQ